MGWMEVGGCVGASPSTDSLLGCGGDLPWPMEVLGGHRGLWGLRGARGCTGRALGGPWRSCWGHGGDLPRVIEFVVG